MFIFRYRGLTKVIVCLLVVALLITSINVPGLQTKAYAKTADPSPIPAVSDNMSDNSLAASPNDKIDQTGPQILLDKSDEYTNVYKNQDGTFTADFYLVPVNYRDASGQLQAIQNEIVPDDNTKDKENGFKYQKKSGPVQLKLPDNLISNTPVQLTYNNYTISMIPMYTGQLSETTNSIPSPTPSPSATPSASPSSTPSPSATPSASPSESVSPSPSTDDSSSLNIDTVAASKTLPQIVQPVAVQNLDLSQTPSENAQPSTTQSNTDVTADTVSQSQSISSQAATIIPDQYKAQPEKQVYDKQNNKVSFSSEQDKNKAVQAGKAAEKTKALKYLSNFNNAITITYTPTSTGLKEEIVLNQYTGQNSFDFQLSVGSLVPEAAQDGSIQLKDPSTDTVVATIPSGTMYDSFTGEVKNQDEVHVSHDIAYSINPLDKPGEYKLTLTVDNNFLNNKNTLYPVTIDPSMDFNYSSQVWDTNYRSDYPNTDCSGWTEIRIGRDGASSYEEGYIYYRNLLTYLKGCYVNSAFLHAVEIRNWNVQPYPYDVAVYRCTTGATSPYIWSNQPHIDGSSPWAYIQRNSNNTDYVFDLKSLCQAWAYQQYENLGLLLEPSNQQLYQYRDFKTVDSGDWDAMRLEVTYSDVTSPPQTSLSVNSQSFANGTGSVAVGWALVSDLPASLGASGVKQYDLGILNGSTWTQVGTAASTATTYSYTGLKDNTTYTFGIQVEDNAGNKSGYKQMSAYTTPDTTGPSMPSLTLKTKDNTSITDWTNYCTSLDNTKQLILGWSGITDPGNHLSSIQYKIDSGSWSVIGSAGSGSFIIPYATASALTDGDHIISVKGVDTNNNAYPGNVATIHYKKDTTAPQASIVSPVNSAAVSGMVYINASALRNGTDASLSNFGNWKLYYAYGTNPSPSDYKLLTQGTTELNNKIIYGWDTSSLQQNSNYTLILTATDAAGNMSPSVPPATATVLIADNTNSVPAGLQLDQPPITAPVVIDPDANQSSAIVDPYVITQPGINVKFERINNGGIAGLLPGKLFVNSQYIGTESTLGNGVPFNAAAYNTQTNSWLYPEGSVVFLYAQTKDSNVSDQSKNDKYSTVSYQSTQIQDAFADQSKVVNLNNTTLNNGVMQLAQSNGVYSQNGTFDSKPVTFAGDIGYVELTTLQSTPSNSSITYQVSIDGGTTWVGTSQSPFNPVSTDGGKTVNYMNRQYFTNVSAGSTVTFRAMLNKSSDNQTPTIDAWSANVSFTNCATAVLINNSFPVNTRGITGLQNTYDNVADNSICLNPGATDGFLYSTVRNTSGNAISACLQTTQNIPAGGNIQYSISTQGANGPWQTITPGDVNNPNNWINLTTPGTQVVLRAEFTGDGTNTPKLFNWNLSVKEVVAGDPHMIKLVDEPWNLSTLTDVNYMTLLRWAPSSTPNVTYNVYRSTSQYFVPSSSTLIKSGLTENYYYDNNLDNNNNIGYEQKFWYYVTAVLMIDGHPRESMPSDQAWATVASQNEVSKRLGLQDYWGYSGFNTGSGTGYVNVSNGNLVYNTTDITVPDPFLAMIMRRTFNSMADTKTPMGYGWDYSFNTCLLKDTSGNIILKDGDGSFHKFTKNGAVFNSDPGSFMQLTLDSGSNEFRITRKDNITYHFDAQTMKLKSFTDSNGNQLAFTYDVRGNLTKVENNVKQYIELTYFVDGKQDYTGTDYTYVNTHPDMLHTITWCADNPNDPNNPIKYITYTYGYDASYDKLTIASTITEGSTTYQELFSYDANENLSTITDPKGYVTTVSCDSAQATKGKVNSIIDAKNNTYSFSINTDNNTHITSTSVSDQNNVSVGYQTNANGLVTKKTDALYKATDPLNHCINYSYDESNYLLTGMNYQNNVNGGAPQSISYSYTYDTNGNILTISGPKGSQTTFSGYTSFNKPQTMTVKKDASTILTTSYTYDTSGNLLTTTDPMGKVTTNSYSTIGGHAGYLTQVQGNFGNQTRYDYDAAGRVAHVKEYNNGTYVRTSATYAYSYNPNYVSDGYFLLVTNTDAMDNKTTTDYDSIGRKLKTAYPNGTSESWKYDLDSNVSVSTDRMGYQTSYSYDQLSRLAGASYTDGSSNSIQYLKWDSPNGKADMVIKTDGSGVVGNEYYDVNGRLIKKSTGSGSNELVTAQYQYDLMGNCTQVTDNAGRIQQAQYNELNQQTKAIVDPLSTNIINSINYDLIGNKLSVTDGEGKTTNYSYYNDSKLHTVQQSVSGATLTTTYSNDQLDGGYVKNSVTDAKGNVTQTLFDVFGNKIKDIKVGTTQANMETDYTYNDNYQLTKVVKGVNSATDKTTAVYAYDNMGQVKSVDYFGAAETVVPHSQHNVNYLTYNYNNNGQKTSETSCTDTGTETTSYSYDKMGRVSQMGQGSGSGELSINYTYNGANNVTSVSYMKDNTLRTLGYVYDPNYGRLQNITMQLGTGTVETVRDYNYTPIDKTIDSLTVHFIGDLGSTKDYREFDTSGINYIQTAYTLNSAGLTTDITYHDSTDASDNNRETYHMDYDKRGYITNETDKTNYGSQNKVDMTYQYDDLGRLTQASQKVNDGTPKTNTYAYDNVGNRISLVSTDSSKNSYNNYDEFNQLKSASRTNGGSHYIDYNYDGRGNQKNDIDSNGYAVDYAYNLMDELKQADVHAWVGVPGYGWPEKDSEVNTYNAAGQRVKAVSEQNDVAIGTTKFYYDNGSLLYTTNTDNNVMTENILDLGGNTIAAKSMIDDNGQYNNQYYYFYHYNMRGDVTNIIKPDGSKEAGYTYDEFGNLTKDGNTSFRNNATFTGSVYDKTTGLQYMNARFYQPATGRFISQDTYSGNAWEPWTQHLYTYCGNNPTNMVDPTGNRALTANEERQFKDYVNHLARVGKSISRTDWAVKHGIDFTSGDDIKAHMVDIGYSVEVANKSRVNFSEDGNSAQIDFSNYSLTFIAANKASPDPNNNHQLAQSISIRSRYDDQYAISLDDLKNNYLNAGRDVDLGLYLYHTIGGKSDFAGREAAINEHMWHLFINMYPGFKQQMSQTDIVDPDIWYEPYFFGFVGHAPYYDTLKSRW